jgi:cytochrome oxidase Cu insertion factor (SCO1/SenC/PrrC family)
MTRGEKWAVGALGALAAITVSWWALALWPVPTGAPAWLERTRQVCFGSTPSGLPDAGGWLLLVGQPTSMLVAMFVIWGDALAGGLRALARSLPGRVGLAATLLLLLTGTVGAGVRVASAQPDAIILDDPALPPETYPRLDREAPTLALVDQRGDVITLARFAGRTVLVTFAFGHCETICPVVLHIAEQWGLEEDDFLLSGSVAAVESVLDDWNVARERDERTGDVSHPALVYILDETGRIAYASTGDPQTMVALALRL